MARGGYHTIAPSKPPRMKRVTIARFDRHAWADFSALRSKAFHDPDCRLSLRYSEKRVAPYPVGVRAVISASPACAAKIRAKAFGRYSRRRRR